MYDSSEESRRLKGVGILTTLVPWGTNQSGGEGKEPDSRGPRGDQRPYLFDEKFPNNKHSSTTDVIDLLTRH